MIVLSGERCHGPASVKGCRGYPFVPKARYKRRSSSNIIVQSVVVHVTRYEKSFYPFFDPPNASLSTLMGTAHRRGPRCPRRERPPTPPQARDIWTPQMRLTPPQRSGSTVGKNRRCNCP